MVEDSVSGASVFHDPIRSTIDREFEDVRSCIVASYVEYPFGCPDLLQINFRIEDFLLHPQRVCNELSSVVSSFLIFAGPFLAK
jgi:hypothetical protein